MLVRADPARDYAAIICSLLEQKGTSEGLEGTIKKSTVFLKICIEFY